MQKVLLTLLLDSYRHFACLGYNDAELFLAAAIVEALGGPRDFVRLALGAFESEREFYGDSAELLGLIQRWLEKCEDVPSIEE